MLREPDYWEDAKAALRAADPVLRAIIDEHEEPPLRSKGRVFETLVHSIVGQQISAVAADAVWKRFVALVGTVDPDPVQAHAPDALRAVGLSGRKVEYILGLAADARWVETADWSALADDEVRKRLTALRGVGPWTVDMFSMFHLNRADVLPVGDFGVRKGMMLAYGLNSMPSPAKMEAIAENWRPTRTLASFYMWHAADAAKKEKHAPETTGNES